MLTSYCAVTTNLIVATSADSCWIAYPALMVNFVWFSDDKPLKFCHCRYKNAQNDHFCTLMGTAWLLHLPARQCTSTHRVQYGRVFGSRDAWSHAPPMLLSANTMYIFYRWIK